MEGLCYAPSDSVVKTDNNLQKPEIGSAGGCSFSSQSIPMIQA
jgi:hypothetical protein